MIETGIQFGDIHSYYDLNLVLSAVEISPATPKTTYIDIPGGDGSIDITEAHGEVRYYDRECKFTFTALPGGAFGWEETKTAVNNTLNGKVFKITLDKDKEYYYHGRCVIDGYTENKKLRQIVVKATVKPWKFKQSETVITATFDGEKVIFLPNSRKTVCPVIECTGEKTVLKCDNLTAELGEGTHKILDFQLKEGITAVSVSGAGTIKFTYQEGDL